jgi:regulatory protein
VSRRGRRDPAAGGGGTGGRPGSGAGRGPGDGDEPGLGEAAARQIALDALSRTAKTRGQLESLLGRKGVEQDAARTVLDRLEEVGLIDDEEYALTFVESRHRVQGKGSRALGSELRLRGVDDEIVGRALAGLDGEQEYATACRLASARYARMTGLPTQVAVRRLAGFLARKGYGGDVSARAVRHALETAEDAGGDDMAWDDEG